ncbi:MAG: ABC-2 transporter permease [Patescibacteria group bacterium]
MNNILNSIKLDYFILRASGFRRLAIVVVVPLFAGAMSKNPPLVLGLTMMLSGFIMSTIFATVEKSNLNKLYGILPIKKKQTVIGRYLFALIAGVTIAAAATVLAFIVSLIIKVPFGGLELTAWLAGSFLVFCLLVSIQFPLYFRYDFSKLAALANLPYIVLVFSVSFLVRKHPELFTQVVSFFVRSPYMLWIVGTAGALILLSASTLASIALYNKREL